MYNVFAALLGVDSSWFMPVLFMSMERGFLVSWISDGQLFWEEAGWFSLPVLGFQAFACALDTDRPVLMMP